MSKVGTMTEEALYYMQLQMGDKQVMSIEDERPGCPNDIEYHKRELRRFEEYLKNMDNKDIEQLYNENDIFQMKYMLWTLMGFCNVYLKGK
ncbi:hypothetical protein DFR58_101317 [Anaerobacterium chartisolvens]|uniref:Uncharacterized protein n=1 Tax=Anaerobacterium chartisolvens TaxID=1297424 RepID=A0A369BKW1_9FIRM|nr:hypothetical protein [Anaerobacterium chartisolvens]RCX21107.1 hypothetical protein DFR58_101317 [Anaerobacterium chartisolvens]